MQGLHFFKSKNLSNFQFIKFINLNVFKLIIFSFLFTIIIKNYINFPSKQIVFTYIIVKRHLILIRCLEFDCNLVTFLFFSTYKNLYKLNFVFGEKKNPLIRGFFWLPLLDSNQRPCG